MFTHVYLWPAYATLAFYFLCYSFLAYSAYIQMTDRGIEDWRWLVITVPGGIVGFTLDVLWNLVFGKLIFGTYQFTTFSVHIEDTLLSYATAAYSGLRGQNPKQWPKYFRRAVGWTRFLNHALPNHIRVPVALRWVLDNA